VQTKKPGNNGLHAASTGAGNNSGASNARQGPSKSRSARKSSPAMPAPGARKATPQTQSGHAGSEAATSNRLIPPQLPGTFILDTDSVDTGSGGGGGSPATAPHLQSSPAATTFLPGAGMLTSLVAPDPTASAPPVQKSRNHRKRSRPSASTSTSTSRTNANAHVIGENDTAAFSNLEAVIDASA
jgi:hypothetical protein